jgi:hypothetical protein
VGGILESGRSQLYGYVADFRQEPKHARQHPFFESGYHAEAARPPTFTDAQTWESRGTKRS